MSIWIKSKNYSNIVREAGIRAIDYFDDTGDCLFCQVDEKCRHEEHCTLGKLYGFIQEEE
jgi:hypothetical protein